MTKSTFAGKSADDTIRNYAEMLIDDLNSNLPESAGEHWNKAREIDNKTAKKIFSEEYGDRIGEAYYNCVINYQEPELIKFTKKWCDAGGPVRSDVYAKSDYIMSVLNIGLSFYPQSANLNYIAAKILIFRINEHDLDDGDIEDFKKMAEDFITAALKNEPEHPEALKAKETIALLEPAIEKMRAGGHFYEYKEPEQKQTSGCFIATAAYGTPFAEEIDVLRNWRDEVLEASYPGRLFIRAYYSLSPPVADNISESDGKRKIVRIALGPIVKVLKGRHSYDNEPEVLN